MLTKKVVILKTDEWEGMFVDGRLLIEGETLQEGSPTKWFLELAEKHSFTSEEVEEHWLTGEGHNWLSFAAGGWFPKSLGAVPTNFIEGYTETEEE